MPAFGSKKRHLHLNGVRQKGPCSPSKGSPERLFHTTRSVQANVNHLTEELTQKTHALASQIDLATSLTLELDSTRKLLEDLNTRLINTEIKLEQTRNSLCSSKRRLDLARKSCLALRSRNYVCAREVGLTKSRGIGKTTRTTCSVSNRRESA